MAKVSTNLKAKFLSEDVEYVGAPVVSLDSVQHSATAEAKQLASASVVKVGAALQKPVESKVAVAKIGSQVADPSAPATNTQKKIRRAERFGVPVLLSEQEKRNSRAERFGIGSGTVKSEELKRKARAERFGLAVSSSIVNEEAKKKARLERFSTNAKSASNEEDKRKARAARFSNVSSSLSEANSKAAVAGGASGGT